MNLSKDINRLRQDAVKIFKASLEAVDPYLAVKQLCHIKNNHILHINDSDFKLDQYDHIYIIGAGKATAPMAKAFEELIGDRITQGAINVKYGHTTNLEKIIVTEAGHPVPDQNGLQGARDIHSIAQNAGEKDLIICLISGGGSALLPMPLPDITLEDKQATTSVLLTCGATIHEINTIRKHLSGIKGGRLAQAAFPAKVICLVLSDVVGDDLDIIASGPLVPDRSTYQDCISIIEKYQLSCQIPAAVITLLENGVNLKLAETPKPGQPCFEKSRVFIIGSNLKALMAAESEARSHSYNCMILSSAIQGEAKNVACFHTAIASEIYKNNIPLAKPACILSGGETTVTIHGNGLGGRNQEFCLAAALDIEQIENIVILSAGTDGNDGPTDAAGAFCDQTTLIRAGRLGLEPRQYLKNNDSYHFFQKLDDLLITGPTNTNVMDIRIILIA